MPDQIASSERTSPGMQTRSAPARRALTLVHMPGYEQPKAEWLADDGPAAVRSCFGTIFAATIIRVVYGAGFAPSSPIPDDAFIVDLGEIAAMRGTGEGEW